MATIKHYKVVAALPSTLVADSIYLVRVGTGFDLYVTNSSGTIVAYPANYQAGSANLSALSGLTGAANKAPYFTGVGAMSVYDLTVFGRSFAAAADQSAGRTLLGLDTAATRAATTSPTDTTGERLWRTNDMVKQTSQKDATPGSVLLTGAGGWMGSPPFLTGNDYNNDSEYCGVVKNDNNTPAVNHPPQLASNIPMAAMNVRFSGSYGWQLGVQTPGASPSDAGLRAFLRQEIAGTWGNWGELWHSLNFNPALKANLASPSFTGVLTIGNAFQANAGSTGIEVGRTDGTAGTGYIDFHAGATPTDYDARIQCTSGNGTAGQGSISIGGGTVLLNASVGASRLQFAGVDKLATSAAGITVSGQIESSLPTYTNLTLQSPYTWDAAGDAADYHQPSYTKVDNVVRLRGKVTLSGTHTSNATVNVTTIATLPVGFRPAKRKAFQVFWDTDSPLFFAYCLVFVNTNGTIVLVAPASNQPYPFTEGHLPLDQIWFDVAA